MPQPGPPRQLTVGSRQGGPCYNCFQFGHYRAQCPRLAGAGQWYPLNGNVCTCAHSGIVCKVCVQSPNGQKGNQSRDLCHNIVACVDSAEKLNAYHGMDLTDKAVCVDNLSLCQSRDLKDKVVCANKYECQVPQFNDMCVGVDSHNASQGKDLKDKVTDDQLNDKGVSVDSLNACQGRDLKDKACADSCTVRVGI